tara:strand:+ start:9 stop:611 length:603 start_codon:yes stop_codon:yes gene_type:complete
MSLIKVKGSSITGALAAVDGSALTGVSGTYVKLEHKNITSTVSSVTFEQKFSATYENYFLHVSHYRPASDNTSIYMRWLSGTNTEFTTTSYNYSCTDYNNTDTNNSFFGSNVAMARLTRGIDTDNTTVGRASFTMNIITPFTTDHPPEYMWHASYRNVTQRPMAVGSGTCNSNTAFTGIKFYQDSGNIDNFTGTLYGIVE